MRVLLLTSHYPPDTAATGQLVADLAEDLAARGHEPVVVTACPSYVPARELGGDRHVSVEKRKGVVIHWMRLPTMGRRGIWSRLLPFGAYGLGSALLLPALGRFDLVYTLSTPPLLAGVLACAYARVSRIPFVYNLQDVYPDIAVALGVLGTGPTTRAFEAVESYLRSRADALVVLGQDMAERVRAGGGRPIRVEVIPNWADTDLVRPIPRSENPFVARHGLSERFVVLYSGNLGRAHGAELLPELAAQLAVDERIVLLVIGEGPAKAAVQAEVTQRGLRNVRFLPYQDREDIPWSLSSADVSLVLQRIETKGLVVPSKLYGILASGRAVVAAAPKGSEVARLVTEHDVGAVVPPGDVVGMAQVILELRNDAGRCASLGAAARALAEARYSRAAGTQAYVHLFEVLAQGAHAADDERRRC